MWIERLCGQLRLVGISTAMLCLVCLFCTSEARGVLSNSSSETVTLSFTPSESLTNENVVPGTLPVTSSPDNVTSMPNVTSEPNGTTVPANFTTEAANYSSPVPANTTSSLPTTRPATTTTKVPTTRPATTVTVRPRTTGPTTTQGTRLSTLPPTIPPDTLFPNDSDTHTPEPTGNKSTPHPLEEAWAISFKDVIEHRSVVVSGWWLSLAALVGAQLCCALLSAARLRLSRGGSHTFYGQLYRCVSRNIVVLGAVSLVVYVVGTSVTDQTDNFILMWSYYTLLCVQVILLCKVMLTLATTRWLTVLWTDWEVHLKRSTERAATLDFRMRTVQRARRVFLLQLRLMYPQLQMLDQDVRVTSYLEAITRDNTLKLITFEWKNWAAVAAFALMNSLRSVAVVPVEENTVTDSIRIWDAATFATLLGYCPLVVFIIFFAMTSRGASKFLRDCEEQLEKVESRQQKLKKDREDEIQRTLILLKQEGVRPKPEDIEPYHPPPLPLSEVQSPIKYIGLRKPSIALACFRGCILLNAVYLAFLIVGIFHSMIQINWGFTMSCVCVLPTGIVQLLLPWASFLYAIVSSFGSEIRLDVVRELLPEVGEIISAQLKEEGDSHAATGSERLVRLPMELLDRISTKISSSFRFRKRSRPENSTNDVAGNPNGDGSLQAYVFPRPAENPPPSNPLAAIQHAPDSVTPQRPADTNQLLDLSTMGDPSRCTVAAPTPANVSPATKRETYLRGIEQSEKQLQQLTAEKRQLRRDIEAIEETRKHMTEKVAILADTLICRKDITRRILQRVNMTIEIEHLVATANKQVEEMRSTGALGGSSATAEDDYAQLKEKRKNVFVLPPRRVEPLGPNDDRNARYLAEALVPRAPLMPKRCESEEANAARNPLALEGKDGDISKQADAVPSGPAAVGESSGDPSALPLPVPVTLESTATPASAALPQPLLSVPQTAEPVTSTALPPQPAAPTAPAAKLPVLLHPPLRSAPKGANSFPAWGSELKLTRRDLQSYL